MAVAAAESFLEECFFQPERLAQSMEAAGRLLGFDYFCLVAADLNRPAFIASDEQKDGVAAYFSGGWSEVDYRARTEQRHPLNTLYLDHLAVSEEERTRSAVYNELYRPRRMAHYAGIRFNFGGEEWFCSASRGENKGVIQGAEADGFVRIARSAMQVAAMAARLQQSRANGMLEGLASSGAAAVVLDHEGRVSAVTPTAEQLFDTDFGVRNGVLWGAASDDAACLAGLAIAARSRLDVIPQKSVLIRGLGRRRPVLINATRIAGVGLDEIPGARLLLILSDLGRREAGTQVALCELFDLSPAEAEVASMIADGVEIPDIAAHRNVATSTVRMQVKNIFRKMDINRQVDLVRIIARLKV